jgi:hypothetical protein
MIDTPGFDDTNRSDIDTLKTISTYLSVSFANNVRINGIVYLHRISDNRLGNASLRNLRMFKKLAGKRTFMNTAIATTMWQNNEYQLGLQRERELMDNVDYFGDMLSEGAKYFRVAEHGTGVGEQQQSALEIVSYLVQQTGILPTLTLNIQRELILEGKTLDATSAGQEALGDLYHLKLQLAKQLQNAHQDMQKAMTDRDAEHVQQLRVFERDCSQKMTKAQEEQEKIKTSLMDMHDEEVERLQKRLDNMEVAQREELQRKRQELEDMEASLKRMREQSAIDAARWERQRLDIATIRRKQRKNEELNRECERQVVETRENVAQEEAQLQSIGQAKSIMRQNIANGAANGATTAITTVIATAGKAALYR